MLLTSPFNWVRTLAKEDCRPTVSANASGPNFEQQVRMYTYAGFQTVITVITDTNSVLTL